MVEKLIYGVTYYLQLSIRYDHDCKELEETCIDFMRSNCVDLFADPGWINVKESVALKALQINNLQTDIDESVFYEAVLRWRESNLNKLEYIDSQNQARIIEQKISSLKSQLKDIKIMQAKKQVDSVENEQEEADTPKNINQTKQPARREMIARWEKKNVALSQIDKIFASMIYCIRFTQIKGEYITDVVENNVYVMRVIGIDYLVSDNIVMIYE
ncbi:hypothetical protein BDF14DRAFT_1842387 [Spinellus fusiger]|nr:hypothetical protein BDF14DRAFT_1842387 [Spinellus fusiger]